MYSMEYTVRVDIIILIVVVFFILSGHLFCSCAQTTPFEAFESMTESVTKGMNKKAEKMPAGGKRKEGFVGASTNNGESSYINQPPINTDSWFTPDLTYKAGVPVSKGVQNILNRPKQPVPLPEGEMIMFANTPFSPSCCPNTYSNSSGCACMTVDQYNYLIDRGGNNVPYSEY